MLLNAVHRPALGQVYAAILLFAHRRWAPGVALYSLALSMKVCTACAQAAGTPSRALRATVDSLRVCRCCAVALQMNVILFAVRAGWIVASRRRPS